MEIGQKIKFPDLYYEERKHIVMQEWEVVEVYPNLVLCKNAKGTKRCFNLGDLTIQGLLEKPPKIERSGWSMYK